MNWALYEIRSTQSKSILSFFCMFSTVSLCVPLFSPGFTIFPCVALFFPLFSYLFLCFSPVSLFSHVFLCFSYFPMFHSVFLCFPLFSYVFLCFSMFSPVSLCFSLIPYSCFPLFSRVSLCFLCFPIFSPVVGFHMTSLKFKLQNYRSYWDFTFMVYQSSWKLIFKQIFASKGLFIL